MKEEPKDIKTIFSESLEKKDAGERAAYLDKVCGNDVDLRAEVEALLKAHEEAGDFLKVPAFGADVTLEGLRIEGPGTMIGRYKLLELIGEGGMGLVYLSEQQEPIRRRVALKIVKLGMDTKQVIARFEAEKQMLALLDHPNIARVYDAGTTETGRPYFVMEYVKGQSITEYCDQHKSSIEERLKLFRQVCEGVQHAHQKGIIHRDIKPSNILVTVEGDRAVPKIIDFGIAKAVTQPLTERTLFTQQGQLLGTPEYMSPEQVDMATQDIDTRCDIYSLGVVLYQLLAGVLPFERECFERAGFAEIQQTIREQEPASPSVRLTSLGEKAKTIAASRSTQAITLARRLHRELEWIPLKAMRKERVRRYRSASELADDIQNYLNGNPLIAGPETAVYRVKKFVRRHAGSVATVALVAAAIILGLIVSTAMYFRSERALQREAIARNQAEQAKVLTEQAKNAEQEQRKIAETKTEDLRRSLYLNSIQLADSKYREGNIKRVHELLDACPADLRGWEWNRLNYISDQSLMTLRGHGGGVGSIALSPNGKHIASASGDNTIKVWNAATGAELMTLRGHKEYVLSVAFSPDGKHIVSGSWDKTIKVWDVGTGDELKTLRGHVDAVRSVSYSPDGNRIVSCSRDKNVKVWDAQTGAEVMTLCGHGSDVGSVAFSPDGKRIVSGSWDEKIKFWDAETGAELMTIPGHDDGVTSIAFSPDGKRIVSSGEDSLIKVWDAATGTELATLHGHQWVNRVAFSPDGQRIVSGGADTTIKLWDLATSAVLMTLRGHEAGVSSVVFSPDGMRIISGSYDKTIKVWDASISHEVLTLGGHKTWIWGIAFDPNGKRVASGSADTTIKMWDAASGTEIMTLSGHKDSVWSVSFSPDGKRIASGSGDATIKVWDAGDGAEVMTLRRHEGGVLSVAFSPDGKRIVSGSEDKTVKVWDTETGAEVMTLRGHEGGVGPVAFSPDGKYIISGSRDKTVKVWDAATGAELMSLCGDEFRGVRCVSFSPDSKQIVSGGYDATVKVWEVATGAEVMKLSGHADAVFSVAFSPDSKRIVSGSQDQTVKVWDATTGTELITLRGHKGYVSCARFSPDGKAIASSSGDGTIKIWESTTPAGGYETRKTGEAARKLVDELYQKHNFYYEVIDKLQADKTLDEPVRKLALQIANSRKWEDAEKLDKQNSESAQKK